MLKNIKKYKKKIYNTKFIILIILLFFITFFTLGILSIDSNNKFLNSLNSIVPHDIKHYIKLKIYGNKILSRELEGIKKESKELKNILLSNKSNTGYLQAEETLISQKDKKKYSLKKFYLSSLNYSNNGHKPIGYLGQFSDKIIYFSGIGESFYFNSNDLKVKKVNLITIPNNLKEIIFDPRFYKNFTMSIKDILILEDDLYASYTKLIKKGCHNTSILKAKINLKELKFKEFFSYDECIDKSLTTEYNAHQSGGRLIKYKDNILFSIGEYRQRFLAQKKDSFFGKIISINIKDKKFNMVSMGHRNPQGLVYIKKDDTILSTEHGPKGGDEVNKIEIGKNYGWPIASYGRHSDDKFREDSPLLKSHKKNGFVEPLKYFVPSIGISQIIEVPSRFGDDYNVFVTSMGKNLKFNKDKEPVGRTIYQLKFNSDYSKIEKEDSLIIYERMRDIMYISNLNGFLMVLENSPALGFLTLENQ